MDKCPHKFVLIDDIKDDPNQRPLIVCKKCFASYYIDRDFGDENDFEFEKGYGPGV